MTFFRLTASSAGPASWETAAYWSTLDVSPRGQQLLQSIRGIAPGDSRTMGPFELPNAQQWQAMFQQGRTTNAVLEPTQTIHQVIQWANTNLGPWTTLCTADVGQVGSQGFFDLAFCDLRPVFSPVVQNCVYGTRSKDPAIGAVFLTGELISAALAAVALPELAVILIPAAVGLWLNTTDLCGAPPTNLPPIDLATITNPLGKLSQIVAVIMWPFLCECIPGTPSPTPYPPPTFQPPSGWPSQPVYSCSNADVCATLVALSQKIDIINAALERTWAAVQLNQRYRLPFASIPGSIHSGLTGQGSFAIERLVGLRIDIEDASPTAVWEGEPEYLKDVGWVSVSDEGAMLQELRITRGRQDWYPYECQLATRFGFFCKDDTRLRITELKPEP